MMSGGASSVENKEGTGKEIEDSEVFLRTPKSGSPCQSPWLEYLATGYCLCKAPRLLQHLFPNGSTIAEGHE